VPAGIARAEPPGIYGDAEFVSHELKSPTSSIITLGRTMADGYYGKIDEKQRDILTRIIKKAEYCTP